MSVEYTRSDDVAIITLDRPEKYNAVNDELVEGLIASLQRAEEEARALVLTGAGKAFCSGADLAMLKEKYETGSPDLATFLDEVFHPAVDALLLCSVPIVGAINGVAAGAGLGLALACDIRVFARSASLTSAFTAIGLAPDSGTTWWLPRHVGVAKALELAMTNRKVDANEAKSLGLAYEVVADDEVVDRAFELALSLADLVPDSLVTTRRLIRESGSLTIHDALQAEKAEQGRLGRTPEHREGVMAFLEKRKANFRDI
jgi:2-(1,2-epoxy-1,2-dihydrophenyl)acetyl-CoA isomerase